MEQNNWWIIHLNKNHKLLKLLFPIDSRAYVKLFLSSLENSLVSLNKTNKLSQFQESNLSSWGYRIGFQFIQPYSLKFVKAFTSSFLNSLNEYLEKKVLNKLVENGDLKESEKKLYTLTKDDFPRWYFADE